MNDVFHTAISHSAAKEDLRMWRLPPIADEDPRDTFRDTSSVHCRVFHLDARFEVGGTWAGVNKLVETAWLNLLENGKQAIVAEHDHELHMVLLRYRDRIKPRYLCLTDTVAAIERTRFYSLERAWRLVHGLVGLVLRWKLAIRDERRWVIIVRNFDEAQHLATRFFTELACRAGDGHAIEVIVQTGRDPSDILPGTPSVRAIPVAPWNLAVAPDGISTSAAVRFDAATAQELADGSEAALEQNYPALLGYYRQHEDSVAAARLAFKVLRLYNRRGYYHEAASFIDTILPCFDRLVENDEANRMSSVSELNSCLVATGDADRARRIVEEFAVPHITKSHLRANMHYILAMHELRYLETRNAENAERHILTAVDDVRAAMNGAAAGQHAFLKAFIDNGLAFLRSRQHRFQEALDLCQSAYDAVTDDLGEDRHRLHRSVLQYNMAQIHVALEQPEAALKCYDTAIGMDPFYTEYHLESANILLRLGRHTEAIDRCVRGMACSPPYPEVYFTKAVCHAHLEQWNEALDCSGISLELEPNQPELHVSRADMFWLLEQPEAAIAEYDKAIALMPESIAMRVNRAVLHFNNGSHERALADMNDVISQEPHEAAHYENRAAIYQAIDRRDLYARDLDMAQRCKEHA